jgi:hypothetical protein
MKKIIVALGLYAGILATAYAQSKDEPAASSNYQSRKLKIDEINLVSSYYHQDGNNSAVTGGIGTEKLFDIANSLDLKLSFRDAKNRLHSVVADFNIDYYSSASSDNIDPRTLSSASKSDVHIYPSVNWNVKNEKKRTNWGVNYAYSTEYDYHSHGGTLNFVKTSKDNNREFSARASAFLDKWDIILPAELRPATAGSGARGDRTPLEQKPRNSYNAAFSVSQVINKSLQVLFIVEPAYQEGLLSTPFHRVYFKDGSLGVERLPGSRLKLPVGLRLSYFLGDRTILRTFYRYYTDNWGMRAHTVNVETSYKITPFLSISPYYRFNTQTAARYFSAYKTQDPASLYHSSDYDISAFDSHFFGTGVRLVSPGGVFGIKPLNSLELRYGHYYRTAGTGMVGNIVTLALKMK